MRRCSRVCSDRARDRHNPRSRVFEVSNQHMAANPGHQCRGSVRQRDGDSCAWLVRLHGRTVLDQRRGEYRQFVSNRVKKIREHERLEWHHVPTGQNPADLGSRGGNVVSNELWKTGPEWLSDRSTWPPRAILEACPEVNQEIKSKPTSQALTTARTSTNGDVFDELVEKYSLRKTLRICAWVHAISP